jgi:hypothetical protein
MKWHFLRSWCNDCTAMTLFLNYVRVVTFSALVMAALHDSSLHHLCNGLPSTPDMFVLPWFGVFWRRNYIIYVPNVMVTSLWLGSSWIMQLHFLHSRCNGCIAMPRLLSNCWHFLHLRYWHVYGLWLLTGFGLMTRFIGFFYTVRD